MAQHNHNLVICFDKFSYRPCILLEEQRWEIYVETLAVLGQWFWNIFHLAFANVSYGPNTSIRTLCWSLQKSFKNIPQLFLNIYLSFRGLSGSFSSALSIQSRIWRDNASNFCQNSGHDGKPLNIIMYIDNTYIHSHCMITK